MATCYFQAKMTHLTHMRFFSGKSNKLHVLPLLLCIISKKIFRADPKLWGRAIFRHKIACLRQKIIFQENHYQTLSRSFVSIYKQKKLQMSTN